MKKRCENGRKHRVILICTFGLFATLFVIAALNANFIGNDDELGYLYNVAKLMGRDWDSVSYNRAYFSPGASFLWLPFWSFFSDFSIIYKCIVIQNGILLYFNFLVLFYIQELLFGKSFMEHYIVALVADIFPAYMYFSLCATSEVLLYLMTDIALFLTLLVLQSKNQLFSIFLGIALGFLYLIHLRSVLLCVCIICFVIVCKIEKKCSTTIIICAFFSIGVWIQHKYQTFFYASVGRDIANEGINTNFSVRQRFINLLSDMNDVTESFSGLYISLFALLNILIFVFVKFCILKIREHNLFYLLLLIVCCLYFLAQLSSKLSPARIDVIFYERYLDQLIPITLVVGMNGVKTIKIVNYKGLILVSGIGLKLAIWKIEDRINSFDNGPFYRSSAPTIQAFYDFEPGQNRNAILVLIMLICVGFMLLLSFLSKRNQYMLLYSFFALFYCVIAVMNYIDYENRTGKEYAVYYETAQAINDLEVSDVYFVTKGKNNAYFTKVQKLQLLCSDDINLIEQSEVQNINSRAVIVSYSGAISEFDLNYDVSEKNALFDVYLKN